MRDGKKVRHADKGITLHPVPFEEALGSALKVTPPPDKKRRGGDNGAEKALKKATEAAIDVYEEALRELANH